MGWRAPIARHSTIGWRRRIQLARWPIPVGRPPNEVRRSYANFTYQAGSWTKARRVVAEVEWHPGELYPRVGFIVANMARPCLRRAITSNMR
jgi:hypothetical protein